MNVIRETLDTEVAGRTPAGPGAGPETPDSILTRDRPANDIVAATHIRSGTDLVAPGTTASSLAARLETLCATMETEFGEFRAREDRAKTAIHLLWKSLHSREEALHESLRRNEEFEQQLCLLREDFTGLRQRVASAPGVNVKTALEEAESRLAARTDAYEALEKERLQTVAKIAALEERIRAQEDRAAALEWENGARAGQIDSLESERDALAARFRSDLDGAIRDRDGAHAHELQQLRQRLESERDALAAGLRRGHEEALRARDEAHARELQQAQGLLESERNAADVRGKETGRRFESAERALFDAQSGRTAAVARSNELESRLAREDLASREARAAELKALDEANSLRALLARKDALLADLEADRDSLAHETKALRGNLGAAAGQEAAAVERGAALLASLVQREESIAELSARLADMTRARDEAESSVNLVAGRVQSIESSLLGLETERLSLEASIAALRKEAAGFEAKAALTRAELDLTISRHREAEASWRDKYGEIAAALEATTAHGNARESALHAQIERLGAIVGGHESRVAELRREAESRGDNETLLEERLRGAKGELARLSEDHAAARSRIEELSMDLAANNAAFALSRDEVGRLQHELAGLRGNVETLSGLADARERDLERLGDEHSATVVELRRRESDTAALAAELHRAGTERARITEALAARDAELREAATAIELLREESQARESDIARRTGESRVEHAALTQELGSAHALVQALQLERERLGPEVARLAARAEADLVAREQIAGRNFSLEVSLGEARAMIVDRDDELLRAAVEMEESRRRLAAESATSGLRQVEINQLRGQIESLAGTLQETDAALAAATAHSQRLRESACADGDRHAREIDAKQGEIETLSRHRAGQATTMDGLVADLERSRAREAEGLATLAGREKAIDESEARHRSLLLAFASLDVRANELQERLSGSLKREEIAEKRGVDLEQALGEKSRAWEDATNRIARLDEIAGSLHGTIAGLSGRKSDLENRVLALQEEIAQWREKHAELSREKTVVEAGRAQLANAHRALEQRKKDTDEVCSGLRKAVSGREEIIGSLTGDIRGLEHVTARVRADLVEMTRAEKQAQAQIETSRREISTLQRCLAITETDKAGAEQELKGVREDHAALMLREADAIARGDALAGELKSTQDILKTTSGSLSLANHEVARLEGEERRLGDEIEHLRTKELPGALEQKVRAFREALDLKAEIELLRSQIW